MSATSRVTSLQRLDCLGTRPAAPEVLSPLIRGNCESLVHLRLSRAIRIPDGVSFPRLLFLQACLRVSHDSRFPRLTTLVLEDPSSLDPRLRLPLLRELVLLGRHPLPPDFVRSHCHQLEVLRIPWQQPPVDCAFPRLQTLQTMRLEARTAATSPLLQQVILSAHRLEAAIGSLVHLRSLDVRFSTRDASFKQEVAHFARQLESLSRQVASSLSSFAFKSRDACLPRPLLSRLLSSLTGLRELSLASPRTRLLEHDVEGLVQRNPGLQVLRLTNASFSSAALVSLSALTRLRDLVIKGRDVFDDSCASASFTSDAVLSLLRGSSRGCLRRVDLLCGSLAVPLIEEEVRGMQEERGAAGQAPQQTISLVVYPQFMFNSRIVIR